MKLNRKFLFFVLSIQLMLSSFSGLVKAEDTKVVQWIYENNVVDHVQRDSLESYSISMRIIKSHLEDLSSFTLKYSEEIQLGFIRSNLKEQIVDIGNGEIRFSNVTLNDDVDYLEIDFEVKSSDYGVAEINVIDIKNYIIETLIIKTEEVKVLVGDDQPSDVFIDENIHKIDQNLEFNIPSVGGINSQDSAFPVFLNATTRANGVLNIGNYFAVPTIRNEANSAYAHTANIDTVMITTGAKDQFGVMWSKFKIDLTKDFEISSMIKQIGSGSSRADGLALVFQNDDRGPATYGSPGWGLGVYGSTESSKVNNALSFEIDTYMNGAGYDYCENFSTNSCLSTPVEVINKNYYPGHIAVVETNKHIGDYHEPTQSSEIVHQTPIQLDLDTAGKFNTREIPLTVKWNSKTQTFTYVYDSQHTIVYKVDSLTETFGGTEVYVGFTGSTGGYVSTQSVRLIQLPGAPVEIQYLDIDTGASIIDSKKISGSLTDQWTSESVKIPHYDFVKVEGTEKGSHTSEIQFIKYYYRKIRYDFSVVKQSDQTINGLPAALSGARFEVKDVLTNDSHILVESSSKKGSYSLNGVMEQGKSYVLTEVSAPPGHALDSNSKNTWSIVIDEGPKILIDGVETLIGLNRDFSLTLTNKFVPVPIDVLKYSSESKPYEVLPNAKFELCLYNDLNNSLGSNSNECILKSEAVTDKDGLVHFLISKPGEYYIREVASPFGFEIDSTKKMLSVSIEGTIQYSSDQHFIGSNGVFTIMEANALKPFSLIVSKYNEGGAPLSGAAFKLSKDGVEIETLGLDALLDRFEFNNLKSGTYTLEEVKAPNDYYPLEKAIVININALGEVTMSDETVFAVTKSSEERSNLITMSITNQPIPKFPLEFFKVNQDDEPLESVIFHLFLLDVNYNVVSNVPYISSSNINGLVTFGVIPSGKYKLVEASTLAGYELPLGYWIIDYDKIQNDVTKRFRIQALGKNLPPAFKLIKTGEQDAYALTNYKLKYIPMVGKVDYFTIPILGILMCGFAGLYLLITDKNKEHANMARGK